MGRSRTFTESEEPAIVERYASGESVLSIAKSSHCDPHVIYHVLHWHGITPNRRFSGKRNIERNQKIVEMKKAGYSAAGIGQRFGLTDYAVYTVLRDWRLSNDHA